MASFNTQLTLLFACFVAWVSASPTEIPSEITKRLSFIHRININWKIHKWNYTFYAKCDEISSRQLDHQGPMVWSANGCQWLVDLSVQRVVFYINFERHVLQVLIVFWRFCFHCLWTWILAPAHHVYLVFTSDRPRSKSPKVQVVARYLAEDTQFFF